MKRKPDYKVFVPVGVTFMGSGVVFISTVNKGVGFGLLTLGIVFIVTGIRNMREGKDKN